MNLKQVLKDNLKAMLFPTKGEALDSIARIGIPIGVHAATFAEAELPSEKAYSAAAIPASLLSNALLWKAKATPQILGQFSIYGATRAGTKLAMQEQDRIVKELMAKQEFKKSPLYKRLKTRVRNLKQEIDK